MHLSAAFQNGFRQLRGDRDTGGVVRLAEKDKVDILSQSIEKLLGQMKPIFFRQIPEANGTAEFLLTHPLKRTEIITAKLASVLLQVLILNLAVWLMAVGSIAVIGEPVPWKEVTLLHTAYFLLQVELACVCFGISAFLWRGGIGIGLGLAIALYFMNIIGNLTSKADVLKYITPFGYADGSEIFSKSALDACKLLIGLAVSVIGVAAAYWKYNKKDIR